MLAIEKLLLPLQVKELKIIIRNNIMKRLLQKSFSLLCISCVTILMPFGLTGCSNDEFADYKYNDVGIKSFSSFTVTTDEAADTRAYVGDAAQEGKKSLYWNEDDEIAVFSDVEPNFKTFQATSVSEDNKAIWNFVDVFKEMFNFVFSPAIASLICLYCEFTCYFANNFLF